MQKGSIVSLYIFQISVEVKALDTCAYSAHTFKDIIEKIQKAVDSLSLKQYSNLGKWVER